jgi:hypothetical protein
MIIKMKENFGQCVEIGLIVIVVSFLNDIKELKWIRRNNFDNSIMFMIIVWPNRILLIVVYITICFIDNLLILVHWLSILVNTCNYKYKLNSLKLVVGFISVDMISIVNIILVKDCYYYFLFQSVISVFIWWCVILYSLEMIGNLFYNKLGAGICGYYIPDLYSSILNNNWKLMIYIGSTNVILMYNPICMFSNNDIHDICVLANLLVVMIILVNWIYNGYIFINTWLYFMYECGSILYRSNIIMT